MSPAGHFVCRILLVHVARAPCNTLQADNSLRSTEVSRDPPCRMEIRPLPVTVAKRMSKNIGSACKDFRRAATDEQEVEPQWKNG